MFTKKELNVLMGLVAKEVQQDPEATTRQKLLHQLGSKLLQQITDLEDQEQFKEEG